MAFEISTTTVAIAAAIVLAILLRPKTSYPGPLPPSPKTSIPIIGQTLLMAQAKWAWKKFDELQISLGRPALMYMRLGSANVLIISTCKAANDLLEKKSAIYSGEQLRRSKSGSC